MRDRYVLENDKISIEVLRRGAELASITKRSTGINYMWGGDPGVWGKFSPNLFPAIGNVKGGGYTFGEVFYPMTKHGFIRDKEFTEVEESRNRMVMSFTSDAETEKVFPFRFKFSVVYELVDSKLMVDYLVKNLNSKTMYFQLGGHTAFSTSLKGACMTDYFLEFERASDLYCYRVDPATGLLSPNRLLFGENVKRVPLNKPMFDGDAYVFHDVSPKSVCLKNIKNDLRVKVAFDDFNTLAVWSARGGGEFVCIEPWVGLPDFTDGSGALAEKPDVVKLAGGDRCRYKYTVLVD